MHEQETIKHTQSYNLVFTMLKNRPAFLVEGKLRRIGMRRRTYTSAFKRQVCELIASGAKRPSDICREHMLKEGVLLRWRKKYEIYGDEAFASRKEAKQR